MGHLMVVELVDSREMVAVAVLVQLLDSLMDLVEVEELDTGHIHLAVELVSMVKVLVV